MRFYPRGPCGPRPDNNEATFKRLVVSIRAARAGRDTAWLSMLDGLRPFLSARPVRAATSVDEFASMVTACFYPRGPCGPRRVPPHVDALEFDVSIRAARAGRDTVPNPHALGLGMFLSARPVRAATPLRACRHRAPGGFYPRGPCGPRQLAGCQAPMTARVSIRAARAGRDVQALSDERAWNKFLSARPVRAATPSCGPARPSRPGFYPRGPCGPRRAPGGPEPRGLGVSIRAARAGRD